MTNLRERNEPKLASASAAIDVEPPCGNPTPDERALDGARSTSVPPSQALRSLRERRWATLEGPPSPPRCFRPRARPTKETSDAPCRAPTYAPSFRPVPSSRSQNRCHHRRVNADGFPGSERLPSTSARETPSETSEPATDRATLPPRFGFRRCFASPMLSRGGARPEPRAGSSSLPGG